MKSLAELDDFKREIHETHATFLAAKASVGLTYCYIAELRNGSPKAERALQQAKQRYLAVARRRHLVKSDGQAAWELDQKLAALREQLMALDRSFAGFLLFY